MKHPTARTVLSLAALAAVFTVGIFAAGPLNPPAGPVTSTYKTLSEVEPRIAINSTNTPGNASCKFRITQPGSYCLTGNVLGETGMHGISVSLGPSGGHVSIAMNGFALQGVAGSLNGVTWEGSDPEVAKCAWEITGSGLIAGWGGYGIASRGSGRISNVRIESAGFGCVTLTSGGGRTTSIEGCFLRTTNGPALVNDATTKCVVRASTFEGDGCNTTSLCYHGGPVITGDTGVYVRNSTFSGSVVEVASTGSMTTDGGGLTTLMSGVTAMSAFHVSPGTGPASIIAHEAEEAFTACTFSSAIMDLGRDSIKLKGINIRADATTSAPTAMRIFANHVIVEDGLCYYPAANSPIDSDPILSIVGADNSISGLRLMGPATIIQIAGSANTVSNCRITRTGADSFTGILIPSGSSNNIVTRNEFVNVGAETAVSNLGGPTNGVAPIVTPGTLVTTTNPLANILH